MPDIGPTTLKRRRRMLLVEPTTEHIVTEPGQADVVQAEPKPSPPPRRTTNRKQKHLDPRESGSKGHPFWFINL